MPWGFPDTMNNMSNMPSRLAILKGVHFACFLHNAHTSCGSLLVLTRLCWVRLAYVYIFLEFTSCWLFYYAWVLKLSILLYYEQVMLLTNLRSCSCLYFKNLYYWTVVRWMYFGNSCMILLVLPEICEFKKTKLPYATVFPASAFSLPVESISTFFTFLKAVDLYLFIYFYYLW